MNNDKKETVDFVLKVRTQAWTSLRLFIIIFMRILDKLTFCLDTFIYYQWENIARLCHGGWKNVGLWT